MTVIYLAGYKLSDRTTHYAIDIVHADSPAIDGRPIYSPYFGDVVYNNWHSESGNYLVLETDQYWTGTGKRIRLTFAHMLYPADYDTGDEIDKGDLIGYVGTTGYSTGEHLHFATYRNTNDADYWERSGNSINPQRFFPGVPFTGKTSAVIP